MLRENPIYGFLKILITAVCVSIIIFFIIGSTFKIYNNVEVSINEHSEFWQILVLYFSAFISVITIPILILYIHTNRSGALVNCLIFVISVFFIPSSYAFFYDSQTCFNDEQFTYQTEFYGSFSAYSTVGFSDIEFSEICKPLIVGESILGIILAGVFISIYVSSIVK